MLTNNQLWELLQAQAAGETIQCRRSIDGIVHWWDIPPNDKFGNWATYRIKPAEKKILPVSYNSANDVPQNGTFGFIRLTGKQCRYLAEGYFKDGDEEGCLRWLLFGVLSNKERGEL